MNSSAFDYTIDPRRAWPPSRRPVPPFGPSAVEVMRSCLLRSLFEASPGYERRLAFSARVGIALHRVLQSFSQRPLPAGADKRAAEEARVRFETEMLAQTNLAASRVRERGLPRDQSRVDRAAEAIVSEALRIVHSCSAGESACSDPHRTGASRAYAQPTRGAVPITEVEIPVASNDGLFGGRVDRAEHRPDGTWLFDYKSSVRDDLPQRYERQLQLYAYMWHEVRREWPVQAQVLYPLTASLHPVSIEPHVCQDVAAESAQLISRLRETRSVARLATPGPVCGVCDFRPWCEPFWRWQADEDSTTVALEKAVLGFAGEVRSIAVEQHYWRVVIGWRNAEIQLGAPQERFPQLRRAQPGTHVRVLDTRLRLLRHEPHASVTPLSEVFVLT